MRLKVGLVVIIGLLLAVSNAMATSIVLSEVTGEKANNGKIHLIFDKQAYGIKIGNLFEVNAKKSGSEDFKALITVRATLASPVYPSARRGGLRALAGRSTDAKSRKHRARFLTEKPLRCGCAICTREEKVVDRRQTLALSGRSGPRS